MVADLSSGDRKRVRSAVVIPDDAPPLSAQALAAFRDLSDLELDPKTYRPLTTTTATVRATVEGEPWLVYLVLVGKTWKISATQKLSQ
jgi:hypothetical protein